MEHSFKGYVQNNLYNTIFNYVSDYIEMRPDFVEEECHKLHQVGVYNLSDIEIARVDASGREDLSLDISNLDDIATEFLQKYYPEALQSPTFVDPNLLVKRMGLKKEVLNITADCSVFGRIYFHDSQAVYYDEDSKEIKTKSVTAGIIFVDPNVFFFRNLGAVNNTVIHTNLK